jgi:hypothetical protein
LSSLLLKSLDRSLEAVSVVPEKVVSLIPHPNTPCAMIHALEVQLSCLPGGDLALVYTLSAASDRLRIPVVSAPIETDGLWQHSCFEAFVAAKGDRRYHEFNFSPSGAWAVYAFADYRKRATPDKLDSRPGISIRKSVDSLELRTNIRAQDRCPDLSARQLQLGISAVIEDTNGKLSYWALGHPADRPDFHHRGSFILELDLPPSGTFNLA